MSLVPPKIKEAYTCPFVVPPGEVLEEKINEMGLSTEEFARQVGISIDALVQLFKGRLALSPGMAVKLEDATGIFVDYRNRAEANDRRKLEKRSEPEA